MVAASEQPAAIRQQHHFGWREDCRGFRHEMHAAENNDLSFGFGRLAAQPQGVAHEIGNVLNLRALVVVREDDCIPFSREFLYLRLKFRRFPFAQVGTATHLCCCHFTIQCVYRAICAWRGESRCDNDHRAIPCAAAPRR